MRDEDAARKAQDYFGGRAREYVTSDHRAGSDLEVLEAWAAEAPIGVAVDVATGGGHAALRLARHARRVVALDLTREMVLAAREHLGRGCFAYVRADACALPFGSRSIDLVSCRIAPHHFPSIEGFAREVARVLVPAGRFLLEDSVAPEDPELDRLINELEVRRDPSHVRSYTRAEWTRVLGCAGLAVERYEVYRKRHDFREWTRIAGFDPARTHDLARWVEDWPEAARRWFEIAPGVPSYTDEKGIFLARAGS